MEIKRLTPRFYKEASLVLMASFNTLDQGWEEESSLDYIKDKSKCMHNTVLVNEQGEVIGFLISDKEADDLVIFAIGVKPEQMGKGYGKALWEEALLFAKENNYYSVRLNSDPRSYAFDWYRSIGFKPTGWVELQLVLDSDKTT